MKKILILTVVCLLVFGYLFTPFTLYSEEKTPAEKWAASEIALGKAMTAMETLNGDLKKHRKEFSELKRNALVSLLVAFTPVDALKTLFTGSGTPERAWELKVLMINIFVQQEDLNQTMGLLADTRDKAYDAYVESVHYPLDKGPEPEYADIPLIYLPCLGGCGQTYSSKVDGMGNLAWKALQGHAVYCSYEPHKRNKNWYWGCSYTSCPVPDQHDHLCVGNCGNTGPAEWAVVRDNGRILSTISNKNRTAMNDELVTIASHKKKCPESISSPTLFGLLGKTDPCPYYYYQCNSSNTCPNKDNHVSGGTPPPSSGGTPPPDNTPNCQDCTSHCSTCNCSNSGTCNGSVYTPPTAPSDNTPDCSYCTDGCSSCQKPSKVYCARSACGAEVSDRLEHRVAPCSACGKGYWTCGDYASYSENKHRVRTCRRSGCGNTWQRCISSTPDCNVASGKRCWAAAP